MKIAPIGFILLLCTAAVFAAPKKDRKSAAISHGPILGRLSHDGVGIWARTAQPGSFRVRYGTSADNLRLFAGPVQTKLDDDCTGWIHVTGLKPNTTYHYRLETSDGKPGLGGSFRTLPTSELYRDPKINPQGLFNFSFEFACGNNQTPGQGAGSATPAFKTMLEKLHGKIHFSIQNGDWLYEDKRMYSPQEWAEQVGIDPAKKPQLVNIAPTIAGVWQNYKVYLERSANLSAYHRNVPTFFTFDDHEMLNDVWGAGSPGLRDRRAVFRDIGEQAWYDYLGWSNPTEFTQDIHFGQGLVKADSDVLGDTFTDFTKLDLEQMSTLLMHWGEDTAGVNDNALDDVGGDPNAGVYEVVKVLDKHRLKIRPAAKQDGSIAYSIGRRSYFRKRIGNCDFFLLDTRSHRQMHDTKNPDKKGLSILGLQQRKWLLDGVAKSDADFIFVVSSVNFMVPHVGGGKVRATNKDDAWTVFLDEREQLIQAFDKLGKPVFMLTGDLHNSFAIKITDRVWEFASGPHNSNNHWYTDEGNRPATGPFQYGPRKCDIRWSTFFRNDIPRDQLQHPTYCVVQVNNVFNNPLDVNGKRWVAFERPQVIFQYYSGRTGDLLYAESIAAER